MESESEVTYSALKAENCSLLRSLCKEKLKNDLMDKEDCPQDLIVPEFAIMWDNVLTFSSKVMKFSPDLSSSSQQSNVKKKNARFHHTSVILESHPFKFS